MDSAWHGLCTWYLAYSINADNCEQSASPACPLLVQSRSDLLLLRSEGIRSKHDNGDLHETTLRARSSFA